MGLYSIEVRVQPGHAGDEVIESVWYGNETLQLMRWMNL